jgi:hypothetical protein
MSFRTLVKYLGIGLIIGSGICASHYIVEIRKQKQNKLMAKLPYEDCMTSPGD